MPHNDMPHITYAAYKLCDKINSFCFIGFQQSISPKTLITLKQLTYLKMKSRFKVVFC